MNSAFVGYEELSGSRKVLSTSAEPSSIRLILYILRKPNSLRVKYTLSPATHYVCTYFLS